MPSIAASPRAPALRRGLGALLPLVFGCAGMRAHAADTDVADPRRPSSPWDGRRFGLSPTVAALIGGTACLILRLVSLWLHWQLPGAVTAP